MSKANNWASVFAAYPDAKEIYVVGSQPFVDERLAGNHARTVNVEIETVSRPATKAKSSAKTGGAAKTTKKAGGKKAKTANKVEVVENQEGTETNDLTGTAASDDSTQSTEEPKEGEK